MLVDMSESTRQGRGVEVGVAIAIDTGKVG